MTTGPNIEMIASSLRNCSLNGGLRRRVRHQDHAEGSDDCDGVTVELNSEVALPYHWQQCLDIRTGQVYYVNWEDGTRTTVDPRTPPSHFSTLSAARSISSASRRAASTSSSGSSYSSASSVGTVAAAAEWFSSATGGYGYEESDGYNDVDDEESSSSSSRSSVLSSALSSFSPTDESASSGSGSGSDNGNTPGHVLVAAGCRGCFMYFMVPKTAGLCPKCGSSGLVHLGGNNDASYYA